MQKKNWKKLDKQAMSKVYGGGVWLTVWGLSLATAVVIKSLFAPKAAVAINGVGKASWENKSPKKVSSPTDNNQNLDFQILENFVKKFYEI